MKGIVPILKKHAPTILSFAAAAGVVGTAILSVKGDRKAKQVRYVETDQRNRERLEKAVEAGEDFEVQLLTRKEEIALTWKCYIPAAAVGVATIVAIFGANVLNRKQIASVTGAYILLDQTYKKYKDKVVELYGKETDQKVRAEVAKDIYEEKKPEAPEKSDKKGPDDDETLLFYEEHYGQYFHRKLIEVMDAEYRINKKLAQDGEASLNDFYEYLGLDPIEVGDAMGWSQEAICDFYNPSWIDFDHELVTMEDGMECYVINILVKPLRGYDVPF